MFFRKYKEKLIFGIYHFSVKNPFSLSTSLCYKNSRIMLSSISWSAYISLIVTATLVYYIVIVLIYFRKDMIVASQKYSHRRNYIHAEQQPAAPSYLELLINQNMTVCDNIRAYLQKATSENIGKEACINELSVIIAKYPMLNDTPFMVSISNFIIKESEYNNITFLPAEEVDALWVKAG